MRRLASLFFLLLLPAFAVAQGGNAAGNGNLTTEMLNFQNLNDFQGVVPIKSTKTIQGSPFINKDFLPGRVVFKNGNQSNLVEMNYDGYNKMLAFLQGGEVMAIDMAKIKGFVFYNPVNTEEVSETYINGETDQKLNISKSTPLLVIYDGDVKLYEHHYVYLNKETQRNIYTGELSDKFFSKKDVLFKNENGEMVKTKLKKKDLLKVIDQDKKKAMEAFIKENKLKMKSREDAVAFFTYYESLTTS